MPTFSVNGMNCGHCTKTITNAILAVDPSAKVETDIPSKTVKVSSEKSIEILSSTISEAGYEVTATGS
ncbi:heavy-metal-associated domain-containing protein [Polynucleobacter sp. MWH-Spelu-300-X4]|uniref:heavy-metal-associated domain-containing protein n=1 Tax=Polynucleobacter sp. MWH-Spelu-300-X4 TaxID=2689109 RepID=UPI001BFDE193|nr:heavy-metal-associated domain-containing protein [Polynucleobacter sp. MWH-Spelu-300-X4]QWD79372.1 heavy-metal-associated domain-containing protein [Polynucleobacter sp. MWH-Spelu-300-X4]